ncbi:diguanylate cyclase [Pseudomonas sp. HAR-UPW-AIA-41]|uniref:putative bifunctional diguanylate cyclase/phosphodiesterase n=1 Tax=Pseudomonas sp. HAR-UPW-AIA-41 TaxID=1985301 RepID=UPI000BB3982D|nr:EAL domain-containing protein [Pseudomonas sp. HAR-UPW-AIA-41]PAV47215.1 diguanylate cyclase [Pseudomonas sp. HAR-UPW-AIA-41]
MDTADQVKSPAERQPLAGREDVTQLATPEHLGLLAFERLNAPGWHLLYLDPSCHARWGVPARDLCGLIGTPYASLMDAAQRLQLHQEIQQQLDAQGRYQVRYWLHAPSGSRQLVELGERHQQGTQELLRGYLFEQPTAQEPAPALQQLQAQNQRLRTALEAYQRTQDDHLQHLIRSRAQQNLIVRLAQHRYASDDPLREAAELITRSACDLYGVSRASLWRLQGEQLVAVSLFNCASNRHEQPAPLNASAFPAYFAALHSGRAIDAQNAWEDPRTRELADSYLKPQGIQAILDAGVRIDGELVGVLCLEHSNGTRHWQSDEIGFAGELADLYAQIIISQQHRQASKALHLFKRAVEQSASAFLLIDRDGRVTYANPSFTAITQYSEAEVQGQLIGELPALENLAELLFNSSNSLGQHNRWHGEFRCRRKNLEPYWARLSLSKVLDSQGQLTHYIGIYEDITESRQALQRIEKLAFSDSLTGMGNRPYFIRHLEQHFSDQGDRPLSLLLVDIDNFKRINDSLGHPTGDKLLVSLAKRLRNTLGPAHLLARLASNEFAVVLDGADLASGQQIAASLLNTLEKPLFIDNHLINVSGSLGLACAPLHSNDPQTLIKQAGLALHKAKANGKHQLQVFNEQLTAEASHKLFLESNLRRALAQGELQVFYQPKLCLKSGRLLGLEALLRWQHPQKGMIRPDQFIQVAEETGLIIPIGKWVVRQACQMSRQLELWGMPDVQIAINLSPRQFSDPELVASIRQILEEERLTGERIELELTESLLLDATDATRLQLEALKSLGLTLAMDDFGTGYSSLSYLKKFPIDVIKIDRSFIRDIPTNQDDMQITAAVVAMAHSLRLKVVAEGIESAEQLTFLRRQNCDIGQGYLFDQPIDGRHLLARLQQYTGKLGND